MQIPQLDVEALKWNKKEEVMRGSDGTDKCRAVPESVDMVCAWANTVRQACDSRLEEEWNVW